jgi:hypothetical protein
MGQMLKDFGEKRENNICLEMGRNNKVATGGSPSAWRLLIAYPHPITLPKVSIACRPGRAQTRREDDFSLKQNGDQIMLARSYPKMASFLLTIRSPQVKASC